MASWVSKMYFLLLYRCSWVHPWSKITSLSHSLGQWPGAYVEFQFGGGSSPENFQNLTPSNFFLIEFRPLFRKISKFLAIFYVFWWKIFQNFDILGGARARNFPFLRVWGGLEHRSPPPMYATAINSSLYGLRSFAKPHMASQNRRMKLGEWFDNWIHRRNFFCRFFEAMSGFAKLLSPKSKLWVVVLLLVGLHVAPVLLEPRMRICVIASSKGCCCHW